MKFINRETVALDGRVVATCETYEDGVKALWGPEGALWGAGMFCILSK